MSTLRGPLVSAATPLVILAVLLLLLMTPFYMHAVLDAAGSAAILGVAPAEAHELSDRTVGELVFGPGTFGAVPCGPDVARLSDNAYDCFYDEAERAHLRDARLVLTGFLILATAAAYTLVLQAKRSRGSTWFWRSVARGAGVLAVALTVVGAFFLVAFDTAFELFHRIFFPGGNWAFDPATQRLVQLYPIAFWQLTVAALGVLAVGGGSVTWWLARRRARAADRSETSRHAVAARSIGRIDVTPPPSAGAEVPPSTVRAGSWSTTRPMTSSTPLRRRG